MTPETSPASPSAIKITTWNVNGLRAMLGKGLLDWAAAEAPDVLCLQEVRARPEQVKPEQLAALSALYPQSVWNPAERPGYSGVATFIKQPPLEVNLGLGADEFDREGRVICTRHSGFLLFNIYFPNGGRDIERVPYKLAFYERLLQVCDHLHTCGEQVIVCGDFNTAHQEIDLRNARQNMKSTGFLPEERAWIDRYLAHGFVDIYRRLYPERIQYTWWAQFVRSARANNVGWRLDYFLVSPGLVERVQDVIIHDQAAGSDHCPVSLLIAG
ncbi:MAG: exodeoxyribonuclease III [Chloroflexota bacterium]